MSARPLRNRPAPFRRATRREAGNEHRATRKSQRALSLGKQADHRDCCLTRYPLSLREVLPGSTGRWPVDAGGPPASRAQKGCTSVGDESFVDGTVKKVRFGEPPKP